MSLLQNSYTHFHIIDNLLGVAELPTQYVNISEVK